MKTFCKFTTGSPAASYVPLPRFLLQDETLCDISNDAKVLYALLPDRMLFRLTPGQMRSVRKLVKRCCNYLNGDCLPLDGPCPQTISRSLICRWFRHAVLPEQPKLEQAIFNPKKLRCCQGLSFPLRSGEILPNLRKGRSPPAESKIRP